MPDMAAWVAEHARPSDRVASLPHEPVDAGVPLLRRPAYDVPRRCGARPKSSSVKRSRSTAVMRRDAYDEFVAQGAPLRIGLRARRHGGDLRPRAVAHPAAAGRYVVVRAAVRIGRMRRLANASSFCSSSLRPRRSPRSAAAAPASRKAQVPFGALRWRSLGPPRGGRSIAVAGSARAPNEYDMGATGGGLWKTTDGGITWQPGHRRADSTARRSARSPSRRRIPTSSTSAPAKRTSAATSSRATAPTSRPTPARRGRTSASPTRRSSAKIRVHPTNPDVVYVAAFGHHAAPNPERGVFRSKDGGKTWEKVLFRDDKTGAIELIIDPKNPQVIYAALWEAYRNVVGDVERRTRQRHLQVDRRRRSLDRDLAEPRTAEGRCSARSASPCPAPTRNRVYAQIEAEDGGFFMSDDAGATWTKVTERRDLRQRAFYYSRVFADPKVKDTVYELNVEFPQVDRRRQDVDDDAACRTATTTTCGSRRTTRAG